MLRVEKTIFLSYRRTNFAWTQALFQDLTQHGFDVFFDYEGIASGDFEQIVFEHIRARAHFLVLLTPSALQRCDDPGDLFRREIEEAIARRRNIVPLRLEGFDFGAPQHCAPSDRKAGSTQKVQRAERADRVFSSGNDEVAGKVFEHRTYGCHASSFGCSSKSCPASAVCRCSFAASERKDVGGRGLV